MNIDRWVGTPVGNGRVHAPAGHDVCGDGIRAVCWCGWASGPRATRALASNALRVDHKLSVPMCAVCGRDRAVEEATGSSRWAALDVVFDVPRTADEYLVCADDPACRTTLLAHLWGVVKSPPTGSREPAFN